jgi:DNA mismatch repair protein MutS
MAGLPEEVTDRAKSILKNLEGSELTVHGQESEGDRKEPDEQRRRRKVTRGRIAPEIQMTLFEAKDEKLRENLRTLDIEKMTPLEALQKLAELKGKVEN